MRGRPHPLQSVGTAILSVGLLVFALCAMDPEPSDAFVLFLGVPLLISGGLVHFKGRQYRARSAAPEVLGDSRPDPIYLRSFSDDPAGTLAALKTGLSTLEEDLAAAVRPFGDLVAIGRPGEPLPLPGAARMYASDAQWKEVVSRHLRLAPLVILRAGDGSGLFWEFGQAVQNVTPERFLILVWNLKEANYGTFRRRVSSEFGIVLPDLRALSLFERIAKGQDAAGLVGNGFIHFSHDWQPKFLSLPRIGIRLGFNDYRIAFREGLRPVFAAHNLQWKRLGRFH